MHSNLKTSSIALLYNGMLVKDDIYDANSARLLVKSGTILNERLILAIKRLNDNRDTIYVSPNVHDELKQREEPFDVPRREELEETTGYADAKDKTIELLSEISSSKTIQKKAISDVAADLSESLGISSSSTITTLINALAPIDEYLQRHCINISLLNGLFGQWLGMSREAIDKMVLIGLLHDCGKALVPHNVLNAPRRLTLTEYEVIKMHAVNSYELTKDFADVIREAASSHHERMDGNGYPHRIKGSELSLEARITAICDIYDAIVSQRSYKMPRSPFVALKSILELRGTGLDSELVDIFIEHMAFEMLNKPMDMSDGSIGIVRSYDLEDIEYPTIEINEEMVKTNKNYFCTGLHTRE